VARPGLVGQAEPLDEKRLRNHLWSYLRLLRQADWYEPTFQLPLREQSPPGQRWPRNPVHYDAERRAVSTTLFRTRSTGTRMVTVELFETGHLWLLPALNPDAAPEQRVRIADAVGEPVSVGPDELTRKDQPRRFYRDHGLLP